MVDYNQKKMCMPTQLSVATIAIRDTFLCIHALICIGYEAMEDL